MTITSHAAACGDLFANPCAAGGAALAGSARRSAQDPGRGATSAATPFLTLPPLARFRAAPPPALSRQHPAAGSFVPVAAMEDVLALRMRQIHHHGHTLEADLAEIAKAGDRAHLAKLSRRSLSDAIEDMTLNKDTAQIRRRLVKACALGLASIDAEDARSAAEPFNPNALSLSKGAEDAAHG